MKQGHFIEGYRSAIASSLLLSVSLHELSPSHPQDGKIEAQVKLTGILSVGALRDGETRRYGTVISPGLYAPVHQHFFVARLDMAVDCRPGEAGMRVRGRQEHGG